MQNTAQFLTAVSIWAAPTIFAIVVHEVMHGVAAKMLGDDTAERAGRLTLNPLAHVDPLGTIVLPALLLFLNLPVFGYAKPVPIDFRKLRHPRSGMVQVAAAGPLANLALAAASAIAMRLMLSARGGPGVEWFSTPLLYMLQASVLINVMLAVFNLIPLLPLDGGRVLMGLLPIRAARALARLEPYGFLILVALLYTDSFQRMIDPIISAITRALL